MEGTVVLMSAANAAATAAPATVPTTEPVTVPTTAPNGLAGGPVPYRSLSALFRRRGRWAAFRVRRMAIGRSDSGMTTAEYAVGTVAACAFAALLYKVVTSSAVTGVLTELVDRALHAV
jgi:hypothetical protein